MSYVGGRGQKHVFLNSEETSPAFVIVAEVELIYIFFFMANIIRVSRKITSDDKLGLVFFFFIWRVTYSQKLLK